MDSGLGAVIVALLFVGGIAYGLTQNDVKKQGTNVPLTPAPVVVAAATAVPATAVGDVLDENNWQTTGADLTVTGPISLIYKQECNNPYDNSGPPVFITVAGIGYNGVARSNYQLRFNVPPGTFTVHIEAACPFEVTK